MDPLSTGNRIADDDRREPYIGVVFITFSPAGVYNVAIDDTTSARWSGTVTSTPGRTADGVGDQVRIDGNDGRAGWVATAHWAAPRQPSTSLLGLEGETPFRRPPQLRG